jgi:HSP20 family protein
MDWANGNFADINSTLPAVNVSENESDFRIEVAAPGMRKEDFKVSIENGRLVVTSERKDEIKDEKKGNYSRHEFSYESFQRSFAIPQDVVNADKIEAKYNDGILHITLPKREEVKPKPAKEIQIS